MKFQLKIALVFALALTALLSGTFVVLSHKAVERVTKELGHKLSSIAIVTATQIDGDEHTRIADKGSMNDAGYKKMWQMVNQIRKATEIKQVTQIYTLRRTSKPNVWEFVLDTDQSDRRAPIGKEYDISQFPQIAAALNGPTADKTITHDQWGEWLSGYAPIHNKYGEAVGIVGVDANADQIRKIYGTVLRGLLMVLVVGLLLALPVSFLVGWFISGPVKKLIKATTEISHGNWDAHVDIGSKDELGELGQSFNQMAKGLKELDYVKQTFQKYVSRQVVEKIMGAPVQELLMGERRHVTIVFSDIRGFTTLSENMNPEEVLKLLNEYFEAMIEVLFKYEGTLDKFLGDGLMAVFGAPIAHPNDSERAVRASLEMLQRLEGFNKARRQKGLVELGTGIGIHSGTAVAGNIGSEIRKEYSVIGDTVNTAARLQGIAGGNEILISSSTYQEIKDLVHAELLPPQTLKGKADHIEVYRVLRLR